MFIQIIKNGRFWRSIVAPCLIGLGLLEIGFQSTPSSNGDTAVYSSPDIATLARVWPTNGNIGISGFCHGLLYYGLGQTDLSTYPSGRSMLGVLTDEELAVRTFGRTPFIRTRNGLRYYLTDDPLGNASFGEVHRDQCLATFAALGLPLNTPITLKEKSCSIRDLLSESVASFDLNQKEPAWTAMAYTYYLPPKNKWLNRFGEQTSFSQMVERLLTTDLGSQSCAGTHIFEALVKIRNADERNSILDRETRIRLDSYVADTVKQVVEHQHPDGSWGRDWFDSNKIGSASIEDRILVTGHVLEVLSCLEPEDRPSRTVYVRGAEWDQEALNSPTNSAVLGFRFICPFTHAARTARQILTFGGNTAAAGKSVPITQDRGVGL